MRFLIALFFISFLNVSAQLNFEKSLDDAFKKAKEQNKIVFVKYYAEGCSTCKKLTELFDSNKDLSDFYNENFINYAFNSENKDDEGHLLFNIANLTFEATPKLVFFSANRQYLHHSGTQVTAEVTKQMGAEALNPETRTSNLPKKYAEGNPNLRTIYQYAELAKVKSDATLLRQLLEELYQGMVNNNQLSPDGCYHMLLYLSNETSDPFFQFWIKNMDVLKEAEKDLKYKAVQLKMQSMIMNELTKMDRKNIPPDVKNKYMDYIKKTELNDNPEVFFQ
jgi:thiol-disulfide isomerase/thioredoxin